MTFIDNTGVHYYIWFGSLTDTIYLSVNGQSVPISPEAVNWLSGMLLQVQKSAGEKQKERDHEGNGS